MGSAGRAGAAATENTKTPPSRAAERNTAMDGTEPTWEYRVRREATVKTVERRRVGHWIEMGAR